MAPVRTGIIRAFRRFCRDRHGVSAVEFALLLPIMLTLFLAGTEITQAITIKRKTSHVVQAIGDLVAQDKSITNAEMQAIMGATTAVVAPYSASKLKITVSSITIDAEGNAKIAWSEAYQTTAKVVNSTVTLPAGLNSPNTSLIWAESSYDYTPPIGYLITGTFTLKDQIYLRPRLSASVARVP